ncbi:tyrosine-type recombinase/integrase [Vibrio vulnificus]|uniref:tyrosine-type recombinase/integrase n=1 Tax=Vibrio vulnificus TaxID=672 RepID=UPI001023B221|nr:tyrosine-type recombinase/integrase [Vibrio vulnificus]RZQ33224.1 hypothetical protein D8T38_18450 [Vibrio vulnificus]
MSLITVDAMPSASPYVINFDYQLQLRKALYAKHPELKLPKYLLATEIRQLAALPLNHHHRMLMLALFNTGARINELLDLTPGRIDQTRLTLPTQQGPHSVVISTVTLRTLKQQRRGKPGNGTKDSFRTVTLYDPNFARELMSYVVTYGRNDRLPLFRNHEKSHDVRINPDTGRKRRNDKALSDQTVRNWLRGIESLARENGITLTVPLTPRTLRHSYAMHLLLNQVPREHIQAQLGHKSEKNTRIYTDLQALDASAFTTIAF